MKLLKVTFYKLKMMLYDRLFFAVMIVFPLLITVAAGYALRYEKLGVIPVAFADEDRSVYSATLLARLSKKEGIRIIEANRDQALNMLKGNNIEAVFVLKEGFQKNIENGENSQLIEMIKSPSSYSGDYIKEVVAGEAVRFITANLAADWVEERYRGMGLKYGPGLRQDVIAYNESQLESGPLMTVNYMELEGASAVTVKRPVMPAATATSVGIIVVFVMFYILFGSSWLIVERINGTLKRLQAGPGALLTSFSGNVLALFIAGMLQVVLFAAVDRMAFGVELLPGPWAYAVFAAYMLSVISISLLMSALLATPAQLQAAAPVVALLTGFAGGCFWNFVDMPGRLELISLFTPQGWTLHGLNSLILNPAGTTAAAVSVGVLISISLILLPASYIIIRVQAAK